MALKKMSLPKISFVTPMKEQDFRVVKLLESIKSQNYQKNKIEIIITDGGSNPDVLKKCKEYGAKIYHNPKGFAEGAGMGKDQGIWESTGDLIVIAESDIELIGKEWINNMIKPFQNHPQIFGAVPKLYVHPEDNPTNRYLSYVGVDPFAVYRSIEGQLQLNPTLNKKINDQYFIETLDKKQPYCMGSNGFMFKKSLINKVGDYAQDVEFIARLSKANHTQFAVVNNAPIWHKNVKGLKDFVKKRVKWTKNYTKVYIKEKKEFNWITGKKEFFIHVAKNLSIIPNIPLSIKKSIQYNDLAWLLHPILMFFSTFLNIYFSLHSREMRNQVI